MTDLDKLKQVQRLTRVAAIESEATAALGRIRAFLGESDAEASSTRSRKGGRDRMERAGTDRAADTDE